MDKKILALILVMVVFLSGCAKNEPVQEQGNQEQIQEETEDTAQDQQEEETNQEQTQETEVSEPEQKVLTIEIDNLSLSQKYVTIEKGTTVVWVNNEKHPHVIAAHYNEFRSPRLEEGDSYNHTFNEVGEYSYICAIFKTQIQGTINVEENP